MDTKIDQLKQIIPEKYILRQEPMKNHTTFRIGGPADIFVAPENMEEIKAVSRFAKEEGIPLFVLGNGSNLLVADDGFTKTTVESKSVVMNLSSKQELY